LNISAVHLQLNKINVKLLNNTDRSFEVKDKTHFPTNFTEHGDISNSIIL